MSERTAAQILAEWIVTRDSLCPPGVQCGRGYSSVDEQDCIACYLAAAEARAKASGGAEEATRDGESPRV